MSPQENIISLIVQSNDLPPDEFRLRRKERPKQMRSEQTQRRTEVIQNQLRKVICWVSVPRELFPFHPVRDREMESWSRRQMDYVYAARFLLVFVQDDEGCVCAIVSEGGNFSDAEFVGMGVR